MNLEDTNDESTNEVVTTPEAVEPTPTVSEVPESSAAERAYDKLSNKEESVGAATEESTATEEAASESNPPESEAAADETERGLDPKGKGPNSWKASVREKFRSLPPDVQQEVLRRENDHQRLLNDTTDLRRFGEAFIKSYAPYEKYLSENNFHPLHAFSELLETAYRLKTGDGKTKASLIRNIIVNNGVDVELIAEALANQEPQEVQQLRRELAQSQLERQQFVQHQQHQTIQGIDDAIRAFGSDPKNEFFGNVIREMSMLLTAGHAQSLEDAYDQACYLNSDVRNVLQQRLIQSNSAPASRQPSTEEKLRASSSVKGAPTGGKQANTLPTKGLSGKEAALAAWERLEKSQRVK